MKLPLHLLTALFLLSCASEPPPPRPPQPLLTAADHEKTVELIVGETVDLHLESNPTTGYSWNSFELPDWKVVKQIHHAYQGPQTLGGDQLLVGRGGVEHWRFQAIAEGETGLEMVYRRGWEEPQEYDQHLRIRFRVAKAAEER